MKLSLPMMRATIERDWKEYEVNNPQHTQAGYKKTDKGARSKEILEGQLPWRLEWFKKVKGSLQRYYDSPMELRMDPTYCLWPWRYTWEHFEKQKSKSPDAINFQKVDPRESYLNITEEWMVQTCRTYIKLFTIVPNLTFQMMVKFLNLIVICLTEFEDITLENPSFHKYYMGDAQLSWDLDGVPFNKTLVRDIQ